jgi:hypothetical protein
MTPNMSKRRAPCALAPTIWRTFTNIMGANMQELTEMQMISREIALVILNKWSTSGAMTFEDVVLAIATLPGIAPRESLREAYDAALAAWSEPACMAQAS